MKETLLTQNSFQTSDKALLQKAVTDKISKLIKRQVKKVS